MADFKMTSDLFYSLNKNAEAFPTAVPGAWMQVLACGLGERGDKAQCSATSFCNARPVFGAFAERDNASPV